MNIELNILNDIINRNLVFNSEQVQDLLDIVRPNFRFSRYRKIRYFNVPCAFDIETSSFYEYIYTVKKVIKEKRAIMYIWQMSIFGAVIIGRTWDEFIRTINELRRILDLSSEDKRLIIYVQNLEYEFQFIRKRFEWDTVFSIEERRPIYALTNGIEFRCSYLLSGYNLETIGNNLQHFSIRKLVGDLDYTLIRHHLTPITDTELGYCINDVQVLVAYIAETINHCEGISKIPITKTGYVREYCRNACFYDYDSDGKRIKNFKRVRYKEIINKLVLIREEYLKLKWAFAGGFTHGNAFYVNRVINDVTSFDFTSAYPTVLIAEKFPMSPGEKVEIKTKEDLEYNLKNYCCLFDVEFNSIESKVWFEQYISESRCWQKEGYCSDNGRIYKADKIHITVTEQDYMIIRQMYKWESMRIGVFYRFTKGYLPTDFVKSILDFYEGKTTLKDIIGKEKEYLSLKEMLNATFGMCVMDIIRDLIEYNTDWSVTRKKKFTEEQYDEILDKYNKSPSRFLYYPWGVWVTAYNRRNLFSGILECGEDYIYSDTDSIKIINAERHLQYFEKYNKLITTSLERALEYHGIDKSRLSPKTCEGVSKPLGVWDFDGHYSRFKTLGAKKYLCEYSQDERNGKKRGKYLLTVAGLSKSKGLDYLKSMYTDIFDGFNSALKVPADKTGKMTHTYIDVNTDGVVTDYKGQKAEYHEMSSIHMENTSFKMDLSEGIEDMLTYVTNINHGMEKV